jgi:dTDP-4-amino-4,6-dideoxygalactose transaminase
LQLARSRIRQHTTEAHAGSHYVINLSQSDLWLGAWRSVLDRYAGALQTCRITCPVVGEEETQGEHHWHFTTRKRQRHQRLAIRRFAETRCILRSDTNRALALLRHCGVVDDQHRIPTADEPVGLNEQF